MDKLVDRCVPHEPPLQFKCFSSLPPIRLKSQKNDIQHNDDNNPPHHNELSGNNISNYNHSNDSSNNTSSPTDKYLNSSTSSSYLIILGSKSSSRQYILREGGYDFCVFSAFYVDEKSIGKNENEEEDRNTKEPEKLVYEIAKKKAEVGWNALKKLCENAKKEKENEEEEEENGGGGGGAGRTKKEEEEKEEEKRIQQNILCNLAHARDAYFVTADQVVACDGRILEKPTDKNEAKNFIKKYPNHFCETIGCTFVTHLPSGKQASGIEMTKIFFKKSLENSIDEISSIPQILNCAGAVYVEHPLVEKHVAKIEGKIDAVLGLSKELQLIARSKCCRQTFSTKIRQAEVTVYVNNYTPKIYCYFAFSVGL